MPDAACVSCPLSPMEGFAVGAVIDITVVAVDLVELPDVVAVPDADEVVTVALSADSVAIKANPAAIVSMQRRV